MKTLVEIDRLCKNEKKEKSSFSHKINEVKILVEIDRL
jgi:hypothetical protein